MATATQEETADNGIFISYSHAQGDWVLDRLLPVLRAGGAGAIVDRDRFVAGKAVVGQMDAAQDQAAKTLLVLSPEYLASDYCQHEMRGRSPATRPSATAGSSQSTRHPSVSAGRTLEGARRSAPHTQSSGRSAPTFS